MQEVNIKQRVVGGLVLLALAVIFVPMVLDFRKDYDQVINGTNIPPKPKDFRVETFALNETPQVKVPRLNPAGSVEETLQQHELVQQKRAADAAAPKVAPVPTSKQSLPKAVQPAAPAAAPVSSLREGWTVQVGSFDSEKNAQGLSDKINKRGYAAFVDGVKVKGRVSYRVRVGPAADKARASRLQMTLQKEMGLKGLVIWHQQ